MSISERLLPEFDREMGNTRKTLERVPVEKFAWKPHEKSGSMGWLASHLATVARFATIAITTDSLDLAVPSAMRGVQIVESREELLKSFDETSAAARAAIAGASDEHFAKPWTLLFGEKTLMTLPRFDVVRNYMMNHHIHHRAQLTVYLRMNDVALPALYGPSADESM
ncbi:MAG: DinB family protein [Candidatus Acidiferrales bacterium]